MTHFRVYIKVDQNRLIIRDIVLNDKGCLNRTYYFEELLVTAFKIAGPMNCFATTLKRLSRKTKSTGLGLLFTIIIKFYKVLCVFVCLFVFFAFFFHFDEN
jgi:hypothetical protein